MMKTNNIFSNTLKYTVIRFITLFTSLFNTMLLSRIRSLGEYGTFSQMVLVSNLVVSIVALGIPNSINYFVAKESNQEARNKTISIYFTLNTVISIAIAIIFSASAGLIAQYFDNSQICKFVYFLMLFPWASIVQTSLENILIVYERVNLLSVFKLSLGLFTLAIAGLTYFLDINFSGYMLLYTSLQVIYTIAVYVIVFIITNKKLKICFDKKIIRAILSFSIPLGISSMLNTLNIEIDKLMVGHGFSTEEMAIYTNASAELPVYILSSSFTVIALPKIVECLKKKDNERACNIWHDTFALGYLVLVFLIIGLVAFSKDVITLIYSEKYISGQIVFIIYCINILVYRCTYYGMFLNASGKSKEIMIASIVSLVINIFLNPIFYKIAGFEGPAIASLIAIMVSNITLMFITKKKFSVHINAIIPWKIILITTIINVVLAVEFMIMKSMVPLQIYVGEIVESIILACIWGIIYFAIVFRTAKKLIQRIKSY